jgi:hypothetical protein
MIADADALVAVYRPSTPIGGTARAWRHARAGPTPVIHINPDRRTVTRPPSHYSREDQPE